MVKQRGFTRRHIEHIGGAHLTGGSGKASALSLTNLLALTLRFGLGVQLVGGGGLQSEVVRWRGGALDSLGANIFFGADELATVANARQFNEIGTFRGFNFGELQVRDGHHISVDRQLVANAERFRVHHRSFRAEDKTFKLQPVGFVAGHHGFRFFDRVGREARQHLVVGVDGASQLFRKNLGSDGFRRVAGEIAFPRQSNQGLVKAATVPCFKQEIGVVEGKVEVVDGIPIPTGVGSAFLFLPCQPRCARLENSHTASRNAGDDVAGVRVVWVWHFGQSLGEHRAFGSLSGPRNLGLLALLVVVGGNTQHGFALRFGERLQLFRVARDKETVGGGELVLRPAFLDAVAALLNLEPKNLGSTHRFLGQFCHPLSFGERRSLAFREHAKSGFPNDRLTADLANEFLGSKVANLLRRGGVGGDCCKGGYVFFRDFPAFDKAIATACFWGRPSFINIDTFLLTVFCDWPFLRGIGLDWGLGCGSGSRTSR